jgi:hypothetical protein
LFDDGWDEGLRIAELNSGFFQSSIVKAGAQSPIFLFNKKKKLEQAGDVEGWIKPCWRLSCT